MSDHAIGNAKAWMESIRDLIERLNDPEQSEAASTEIQEAPLSVQVRSGWYSPGAEPGKPEEYEILLSTGGPALRIVGPISEWGDPEDATLQWQDWGTPWTDYYEPDSGDDEPVILHFARQFCYGEG